MAPSRQVLDGMVMEYLEALELRADLLSMLREEVLVPGPSTRPPDCRLARMFAYASDGTMEVAVSRLSGETDKIDVWQWTTVQDLKSEIESRMQIPIGEQVLLKHGRELKGNDDSLAAHRITFTNASLEVLRSESRQVPKEEQSLTISFKAAEGIPDGSILSLRAGAKGRQTPLRLDEPFRLPTTKEASSLFKVDVFSSFGRARITLRPGKYEYSAEILGQDGQRLGSLDFEARDTNERERGGPQPTPPPRPMAGPSRRAQATVLASSYLEQHGLLQYLQGLLQSVLREKPADPYDYMIRQLRAAQLTQPSSATGASSAEPAKEGSVIDTSTAEPAQEATATGSGAAEPAKEGSVIDTSTAEPAQEATAPGSSAAEPAKEGSATGSSTAEPAKEGSVIDTSMAEPAKEGSATGSSTAEPAQDGSTTGTSAAEPPQDPG